MNTKIQTIRKLRHPENKIAQAALAELRANGSLTAGILSGLNLRHVHFQYADLTEAVIRNADLSLADLRWANLSAADLSGAQLNKANLYRADFSQANLQAANLIQANLQGALNLSEDQLRQAHSLRGAVMPDGCLYDGRFHLPGDKIMAQLQHVSVETRAPLPAGRGARIFSEQATLPQLISRLRSSDSRQVIQALEELRRRACHCDGSLRWLYLRFVHLQSADLSGADLCKCDLGMADLKWSNLEDCNLQGTRLIKADLRGANLAGANLNGTHLAHANLQGASNLSNVQLAQASRLQGAMMPDGSRYDGRFNLVGDLANARFANRDANNPAEMADFYGVSLEEYQAGQVWIMSHPTQPWFEISDAGNQANIVAVLNKYFELERQNVQPA